MYILLFFHPVLSLVKVPGLITAITLIFEDDISFSLIRLVPFAGEKIYDIKGP
jgi:hypothetical protein